MLSQWHIYSRNRNRKRNRKRFLFYVKTNKRYVILLLRYPDVVANNGWGVGLGLYFDIFFTP